MLGGVDWETRCGMHKASKELIEPTKEVVKVALEKLEKFGRLDPLPSDKPAFGQYLFLGGPNNEFYEIHRVKLDTSMVGGRVKIQIKDKSGGLYIKGIQLNSNGNVVRATSGILIPQDPDEVTQENIYLLRGISPSSMVQLAEGLKASTPMGNPSKDFKRLLDWQEIL